MSEYLSKQLKKVNVDLKFHKEQVELHKTLLKKEIKFHSDQVDLHESIEKDLKIEKGRLDDKMKRVDKMDSKPSLLYRIFAEKMHKHFVNS